MSHQAFNLHSIPEISVEELATRLEAASENLQLIDVREPEEVAIAHLDRFEVLPLSQFTEWSNNIQSHFDPHAETLVICHHGIRSAQMCQWLRTQGFTNVKNIAGGINAYSLKVDPTMPQY